MPRRAATTAASTADTSRMALAKAIAALAKTSKDFSAAYTAFCDIKDDTIATLDKTIEIKQKEHEDAVTSMAQDLQKRKITADHELLQYKRDAAVKMLKETSEEPIASADLQGLRARLQQADADHKRELDALRATLTEQHKKELAMEKTKADLQHKAELAALQAAQVQHQNEIASLKTTIKQQQAEIAAQRELTQRVAEASKAQPITQSFGRQ